MIHVHDDCCIPATDEDPDICTIHSDDRVGCVDDGTGVCWGEGVAIPPPDSPRRAWVRDQVRDLSRFG